MSDTATASVDGKEHPASDFAYVPDPSKPSTWKFPIFDANHVRDALARFDQADLPADAKAHVRARILVAAQRFGIHVSNKAVSLEPETKSFGTLEIKDVDKGEVVAVVNTFNVVDRDGDVMLPGAIQDGTKVKMSSYSHGIIKHGEAPVGKGVIAVEGDRAVFRGNFFLTTERGREAFETVKALGPDSEWSVGFFTQKSSAPSDEWKAKGARRMIVSTKTMEVSPVFIGANAFTGTLAIKEADEEAQRESARVEAETKEAARLKALNEEAASEFERFQRNMRRLGGN